MGGGGGGGGGSNDLMCMFLNFVLFLFLKDEFMDGCTNGYWKDPNGKCHQLFTCKEGKGLCYPVEHLIVVHEKVSKLSQENCKLNISKQILQSEWDIH